MCRLKIHPAASELSMQLCSKQHAKFGEVLNQLRTRFTSNVHCRRARYVNCTLLGGAQHVLSLRSRSAGIGRRLKAFNHSFWAGLLAKLCRKWITWKVHKITPSDIDKLSELSDNVAATTTQSCSLHLMANDFTILYPKKPAADRGSPQATGPSTDGWSAAVNRDLLQLFTTPQGKKTVPLSSFFGTRLKRIRAHREQPCKVQK